MLQGKVSVNHCSPGHRGLPRHALRLLLEGWPMRNLLNMNGTIPGTFSSLKATKLPSAASKDDLLASHQQPCALKTNVSQGCSGSLQHHANSIRLHCYVLVQ